MIIHSAEDLLAALAQRVREPPFFGAEWGLDGRSTKAPCLLLHAEGQHIRFKLLLKPKVTARDLAAHSDFREHPVMLVTVDLSDSIARRCHELGLSALSLNGRLLIRRPGLIVDQSLEPMSIRYRSAKPRIAPFRGKSSRVARALLSPPGRTWTLVELAETIHLSLSRVSEVLKVLVENEWVEGSRGDWHVAKPDRLLDAWARADAWPERSRVVQYASLEPTIRDIAGNLIRTSQVETAFTQWFAASLRHPYTQPPVCSAYRRLPLTPEEQEASGFREVASGGKLWIILPRDEGVFQFGRTVDGFPLVCDAQIYLDLLSSGLRGPDQAQALRTWAGFLR